MKIQNGPFALQMSQVLEFANALKIRQWFETFEPIIWQMSILGQV